MTRSWLCHTMLGLALPFGVAAEQPSPAPYPNGKLLIEPAALAQSPLLMVVLDVRQRQAYDAGHIPGAVLVDHDEWAREFRPDATAIAWSKRIGGIGINGGRPVVVYDDESGKNAARIWWILRYWGVADVRLLNGFWHGWKQGGHPTETTLVKPTPVAFRAQAAAARWARKHELESAVATPGKLQILDARSQAEFTGLLKLTNRRGGHVPGARHLDWSDFLDPKTQRFKPAAQIEQMLQAAGIAAQTRCVTYCQSGGRASVAAFTLELMGRQDVANYYESWKEWGNDPSTPIE